MKNTKLQKINKEIDKARRQGNTQKAIEICQCAITEAPGNPDTAELHIKLGDLYLDWHLDVYQAKQYLDEAITQYQQAMELNVDSAEIYYKIGCAFYFNHDYNKAIDYLNKAIEKNPKYDKAYLCLAKCYAGRNEIYSALEYVNKAIKVNRLYSGAYLARCMLQMLATQNIYKKTGLCFVSFMLFLLTFVFDKKIIKYVISQIMYLKFLPTYIRANIYVLREDYPKAVSEYRRAIEKAPRFAFLYELLGEIYHLMNCDTDAICEFKMAIWLNSLSINSYRALCYIYEKQGDYDAAIDICQKLIQIQPYQASYYSELASLFYLKEELNGALANFQNALTLGQKDKKSLCKDAQLLGCVLQSSQNYDAAIANYQIARIVMPTDIEAYINLGNAFYDKGEYTNAQVVYKKALELSPCNARIHCNLGYLYWGCGNIEEAIKSYELAIKYDDTYAIAYNNLGVIYLDDLGRVQKAAELFEAAAENNSSYALAFYNLGRTKEITSDNLEAAKYYQIAYNLNQFSHEIDPNEIMQKIERLFSIT